MARQPFYHSASVLFTATSSVDRDEFTRLLAMAFQQLPKKHRGNVLAETIVCEQIDDEPGDPADL